MDDLEAIRQRRLRELQQRQAESGSPNGPEEAEAQAAAQEAAVERVLQQILEPEARERLTRIRMSRPELADLVTRQLVAAVQQGALARRVTDEDLKQILGRLMPRDRDTTITRK